MSERIAQAIYDAPNGIDDDQLADMLIDDVRITGADAAECQSQVMAVCMHAARAVLAAIEASPITDAEIQAVAKRLAVQNGASAFDWKHWSDDAREVIAVYRICRSL
jgi:hypothetical protein